MSHSPVTSGGVVATRYVVPRVTGDAGASYRASVAYQELADAVWSAQRHLVHIVGSLGAGWRGPGYLSLAQPVQQVIDSAVALARALDGAAAAYQTYAKALEAAHERHRWSMSKVLKVGAVVAISAGAIVVTVGAAGAVEAAGAAAAVSGATAAADDAMVADLVAESALEAAFESVPALRPLLTFVMPNLVQAEWAAGASAAWNEGTTGQLHTRSLLETGGIAFGASSLAVKARGWLEASIWAGAAGADDEVVDHRIDLEDIAESFVLARGATFGRDAMREHGWWPEPPDYRREALVRLLHRDGLIGSRDIAHELAVLRQPVGELERGVIDLELNEGPGHTIARHVGRTPQQLLSRVRHRGIPVASTYWDAPTARDAIQGTLSANSATIRRWSSAGCPGTLRLRLSVPYDVGFAIDRAGKVSFVRHALVVLRRDPSGVVLVTSFPRR